MLIALAGLPATGKSTLAHRLAEHLHAVVLDKDQIRASLFLAQDIDYTSEQNDLCGSIMFEIAGYLLKKDSGRYVILDGRTFSKRYQVRALRSFASQIQTPLRIIECIIPDNIAHKRLLEDVTRQSHLAANRNFELYRRLKAQAEDIDQPKLVIDTSSIALDVCTTLALDYIKEHPRWKFMHEVCE